jgi:hypothetical protein
MFGQGSVHVVQAKRHPFVYRNYEERVLRGQNSAWPACTIHQEVFPQWKL